ncbi:MAG: alpha-L-fucosidase [Lachnospiraceae bacterium]|nr:alpha-L-fucosidase [Lachnospiraceae bacterium]
MKEIIDNYQPDLLYSDSWLPFEEENHQIADSKSLYRYGLEAVAHLYNTSERLYGSNRAVYTQKHRDEAIYRIGVLDIERSQLPDICPVPWQSETCIGGWFYDKKAHYKTPRHILDILIDSIAKNGTLLLNILQRPDGTIDEEADWILSELAKWFAVNAEAVHGTRPFRVSGEGHSCVAIDGFREDEVKWQEDDFRFVVKENAVYAFIMKPGERKTAVIKSFREDERVKEVGLLGSGPVPFAQHSGILVVDLPERRDTEYPNVLKILF